MEKIAARTDDGKAEREAWDEIVDHVARNAKQRSDADREEVQAKAYDRWRAERKASPATYAKRALLDLARKQVLRGQLEEAEGLHDARRPADVESATVEALDVWKEIGNWLQLNAPGLSGTQRAEAQRKAYQRGEEKPGWTPAECAAWAFDGRKPKRAGKPRKRVDPAQLDDLKAAVRSECLKQFEKRLGKPWDTRWERSVLSSDEGKQDLDEAHEVFDELRAAMEKAIAFVDRPRVRFSSAPLGLGWWVDENIRPLMEHAFMEPRGRQVGGRTLNFDHKAARQRLVATWDDYDMLHLPRLTVKYTKPDGTEAETTLPRVLDATEFAIVWLLGGGWPESLGNGKPVTPSEVIQIETRSFRKAIDKAGRPELRHYPTRTG